MASVIFRRPPDGRCRAGQSPGRKRNPPPQRTAGQAGRGTVGTNRVPRLARPAVPDRADDGGLAITPRVCEFFVARASHPRVVGSLHVQARAGRPCHEHAAGDTGVPPVPGNSN